MAKRIPEFASEEEERAFWGKEDSADYVDWSGARSVTLPKLKSPTRTISLRLPEHLLEDIRLLAKERGVPYQSLIRMFLAERVEGELRGGGSVGKLGTPGE